MKLAVLLGVLASFSLVGLGACGGSSAPIADGGTLVVADGGAAVDGGALVDGGVVVADAAVDKAANCASTFGNEITASFGRIDGTVRAVLKPTDQQCPLPNSTHIIVQVDVRGATYRMVVNDDVLMAERQLALPGVAWSEGWHAGTIIDYVATLGVHSTDFTPYVTDELVRRVVDRIDVGAQISIYAGTTNDHTDSAHLVHRSTTTGGPDGAIVVGVGRLGVTPTFLLFRFANQTF